MGAERSAAPGSGRLMSSRAESASQILRLKNRSYFWSAGSRRISAFPNAGGAAGALPPSTMGQAVGLNFSASGLLCYRLFGLKFSVATNFTKAPHLFASIPLPPSLCHRRWHFALLNVRANYFTLRHIAFRT